MILSVHQPQYMPWLGFFHKIDQANLFVLLDNVQFKKNEWQNRNRIKTARGWQWITVPVLFKFPQKISEVRINNKVNWSRKHLNSLISNYSRAPYFFQCRDFFENTYRKKWESIVDISIYLIRYLSNTLGIKTKMIKASQLSLYEDPNERLIGFCKELGADTYLSGEGGRGYLDIDKFRDAGIKVVFQNFQHPVYRQLYDKFQPNMSVVDLLFNSGEKSLAIIRGG